MTRKHNPLCIAALSLLFGLLALLIITAAFRCLNAPIERDIANIQSRITAAQAAADEAHAAWVNAGQTALKPAALAETAEPELLEAPEFKPLNVPLSAALQEQINIACEAAGVPFEVVMGIIHHESRFQPDAVSPTDDHGLMQVNAKNFGALGLDDPYDPMQNVEAALRYLGPLWAKYPPEMALWAYGRGETGMQRMIAAGRGAPAFVGEILTQAARYEQELSHT